MATALGKTVLACLDIERQLLKLPPRPPSPPPPPSVKTVLVDCTDEVDEFKVQSLMEMLSLPRTTCAHALSRNSGDANLAANWLMSLPRMRPGGSPLRKRSRSSGPPGAGGMFKFLFLVHTMAIRDSAFEKFKKHFTPLNFKATSFCNVTDSSGAVGKDAQFIFCVFQSFARFLLPPPGADTSHANRRESKGNPI